MKTDENIAIGGAGSDKRANKRAHNPEASKQKNQLIMLSGLAVLLVAVLFVQFSGSEPENEVAALMDVTLEDPTNAPDGGAPAVAELTEAKDNPVLLQSEEDDGLLRNAFSNFWDSGAADEGPVAELTPPSITLSGTMPGEVRAIAIIDGRIHFLGDTIDGWKLTEIRPRSIALSGPGGAVTEVDMPVIFGRVSVPEGLDIPADTSAVPIEDELFDEESAEPDDD